MCDIRKKSNLKTVTVYKIVFKDKEGKYYVCDWKRSKEIKENNLYEEGNYPLSHIPNANYWHYTLQLNIYKRIIEKYCFFFSIFPLF